MKTYKNDEGVLCPNPECRKPLEDGAHGHAHNFVVNAANGNSLKLGSASRAEDRCGWCDAEYIAERIGENAITIKLKY